MIFPVKRPMIRLRPADVRNAFVCGLLAALLAVWTVPVAADPPPWAPAHGWRAKQKYKNKPKYYANYQAPYDLDLGRCNRVLLGGALGGATGAALGSTVDRGDGRTAAVVGGTIVGVLVGGALGNYLDSIDQNCVGQTLEHADDGGSIAWRNPENGGAYQVTPQQTYRTSDGRTCRDYVTEIWIDDRKEQALGTACRQPDGSWKITRT
jgi:surface antigen